MEKTTLYPCPFDERNLLSDWIEDELGENGTLPTPKNGGDFCEFVTYLCGALVKISYKIGDNYLSVNCIAESKNFTSAIDRAKAIVQNIEEYNNQYEGARLVVKYYDTTVNAIIFRFYYKD